jgi:hypothetical protein
LPFLIKAFIEFLSGKNSVLLLTMNYLTGKKFYWNYPRYIVNIVDVGQIKFIKNGKPMPKAYKYPCSLIYFLQPPYYENFKDKIECLIRKIRGKNIY